MTDKKKHPISENSDKNIRSHPIRKHKKILLTLIIILGIIISYVILNFALVGSLKIVADSESINRAINSFTIKTNFTDTTINSEITVKNPTMIPLFTLGMDYYLSYDEKVFGEGRTGFLFVMPHSEKTVQTNLNINHVDAIMASYDSILGFLHKDK